MKRTIALTNQTPVTFEEDEWPVVAQAGKEDSDNFLIVRAKKHPSREHVSSFLGYGQSKPPLPSGDRFSELMTIFFSSPSTHPSIPTYFGAYASNQDDSYIEDLILRVASHIGNPGMGQEALNSIKPREI